MKIEAFFCKVILLSGNDRTIKSKTNKGRSDTALYCKISNVLYESDLYNDALITFPYDNYNQTSEH